MYLFWTSWYMKLHNLHKSLLTGLFAYQLAIRPLVMLCWEDKRDNSTFWTSTFLDVYYVAFGVKNSYGKDIYLSTNMRPPYNTINIPKDQQMQRTIVLLDQNLVNVRAHDAATRQNIKIDDRDYITLRPNRSKPTTLRIYHVPKEGKY